MNAPRNLTHAARVLDHLSAQDSQWPLGSPAAPTRPANDAARELAAQLRKAVTHLASLSMVPGVPPDVARTALAFANESKALLRRCEGK